jgi:FG-GAP repeat
MTFTFRLSLAVPLLATAALLSACAGDKVLPLNPALLAHMSLEGLGWPAAWVPGTDPASTHLQASDATAGDVFGAAVALSRDGNTLAVGAELKTALGASEAVPAAGSVYVYTRTPQGWREQARLLAPAPVSGSGFGHSLTLSDDGSRLAVGAPFESHPDARTSESLSGDQGVVYVFERSAGGWSQPARLRASNAASFDWFGTSLAFSGRGDALAVGAHRHDSGDPQSARADSGAVYVFARTAVGWAEHAVLTATDAKEGAQLGQSVAFSADGQTLAAGARGAGLGAVHVFRRDGWIWREQAVVAAANAMPQNPLGAQVALSADGTTLAVGASAPEGTEARQRSAGSAYVFVNQDGHWRQQARVRASNNRAGDAFGERLSLSADGRVLAVSAVNESSAARGLDGKQTDTTAQAAGAVYVYTRQGQGWDQTDYVKSSRTRTGDQFGSALALSGDGRQLAVGARLEGAAWSLRGWLLNERFQNSGGVHLYSRG